MTRSPSLRASCHEILSRYRNTSKTPAGAGEVEVALSPSRAYTRSTFQSLTLRKHHLSGGSRDRFQAPLTIRQGFPATMGRLPVPLAEDRICPYQAVRPDLYGSG